MAGKNNKKQGYGNRSWLDYLVLMTQSGHNGGSGMIQTGLKKNGCKKFSYWT